MKLIFKSTLLLLAIFFVGCSTKSITTTQNTLPAVYESAEKKTATTISLFILNNYTDTPRAGMRASNLIEGILLSKGYQVSSHLKDNLPTIQEAREIAQLDGSHYFMYGGVSEWRYKTGIDGEPAVSLQISLYDTNNLKPVWSATVSDSDWGNASIGTTAQDLLDEVISQ